MYVIKSFSNVNEYLNLKQIKILGLEQYEIKIGWFQQEKGALTVLFIAVDGIYIVINKIAFKLTPLNAVLLEDIDKSHRRFKLFDQHKLLSEFIYEVDKSLLNIQPFDYLDEEDFDWGIFLSNVINNRDRQLRILENL